MAIRSDRVLLTGSAGFTGAYLRSVLEARGDVVIGLINDGEPAQDECVADLTDTIAVARSIEEARPDLVVHLGGIAFVAHDDVAAMYAVNTLGSLNLLEALAKLPHPPRRVVLASTANVYAPGGDRPLDESAPLGPVNHYGASKLAMEMIAGVYREGIGNSRLSCTVTRPFNYTGPGQAANFLVPKLVDHFARRADRIELGNLDIERDFLDVRTVAAVYADLLHCESADGATVNICSGQAVALREIITRLERITGHTMQIVTNPAFVRSKEIHRLVGNNARLRRLLDLAPSLDLDATLCDMLDHATQRITP